MSSSVIGIESECGNSSSSATIVRMASAWAVAAVESSNKAREQGQSMHGEEVVAGEQRLCVRHAPVLSDDQVLLR